MTPVVLHPDDADDADDVDVDIRALDWSGRGLTTTRSLALDGFARVTTLNVSSNGLLSLRGIERLPALRTLDARFNALRTLDELSNGPVKWTLRALDASGNAIESVRGLALPALRTLRLSSNALRDEDDDDGESAFRGMEALKILDVADNALTRVPNASACLGLRAVGLSRNALSSLEASSRRLPATVTDLDIRANDVVDVEEFRHLRYFPRLARLWFKGNPMEARAVHYGYDARAVAAFCAASLRECDGASVIASSWGKAARTRLFRNDSGELCEDLLAMLSEGVQPWFLGQYLHSVCGRPDETTPKRRASAMTRDQSAMFSVSSFVPLKKESGGDDVDDDDDGGNGFDDDDDNGEGQTFTVEAERVVYANGDAERAPRGLDSTADWLSQIVSDESSDDEKEELEREDQTPVKGSANATRSPRVGFKPADEMSVDELRMISPIRQTPPSRTIFVEDNDEETTRGDSTVESTAFYSMEDEPTTSPRGTGAAGMTTTSASESSSQSMRLLRATDVVATDAKSTKRRNEARRREKYGKRDLSGDFQDAQKDILSGLADESFENSPDLRPPPATPPKRRDPNAFVFTDDSESFLDDFSEDDEDELSLRSFILTGDEDVLTSPQKQIRSDLRRAVSDLAESAASPKRVAATAKKIEGMISAIKQSRVRAGDYSSSNSLSTQQ